MSAPEYDLKVSVVIVSYNVKYFLEQCLYSVRAATVGMDAEVFVVDNASTDGSVEYLAPKFPEATFISNTENVGFAKANNQALRLCGGQYVLLLNPDTVIGEENIRSLCYFMDEHPHASAAGVKMLDGHGVFLKESKRSFPSPWVSFCKMFGLSSVFPKSRLFSRYNLPYLSEDKQHKVQVLAGAYMMMRNEALLSAGLLDEAFFMYGEDIDLSYRMVADGGTNYYVPERILHYKGESSKQGDMRYVKAFYGAMLIFFRKYYPHSGWLMTLFVSMAVAMKAVGATVARLLGRKAASAKRVKHRRLLVICSEASFEEVKAACADQMPDLEYVNLWDLDTERVMEAICRRNMMKGFTDIAFCYPEVRFEQMLLLMDTMVNKKTTYHIYNKKSTRLVSPGK